MSETLPISSQAPMVWDEKAIDEKGMLFLGKKKEELAFYHDIWQAAIGTDYYNCDSKLAAEKVKTFAEKSSKEIETLNNAVTQLFEVEAEKDPFSDRSKQLSKIAIASRHALNYFTSVVNDTYYPTPFRQALRDIGIITNKLAPIIAIPSVTAFMANHLFFDSAIPIPSYAFIPLKVSMIASLCISAIRILNQVQYTQDVRRINAMNRLFEKALLPEREAA